MPTVIVKNTKLGTNGLVNETGICINNSNTGKNALSVHHMKPVQNPSGS